VDGNGDGIADSSQASVATFTPAAGAGLVTLAAPDSSYSISAVRALPAPASPALPDGTSLPLGVIGFTVTLPSGESTADVDVITPPGTNPNSYLKLQAGAWADFTAHASFAGDTITLHLVDNDEFDTDRATGVIGDPGGPAVVVPPIVGTFLSPVDGQPTVNSGKAGRAYPVKFRLASGDAPVTDLGAVTSVRYRSVPCSGLTQTTEDALEVEVTGASALRVTDGTFHVNWATPSTRGCYQLVISLSDGGTLRADFNLR
jgi:hypothetical protein